MSNVSIDIVTTSYASMASTNFCGESGDRTAMRRSPAFASSASMSAQVFAPCRADHLG
jgi:hypothetical protein